MGIARRGDLVVGRHARWCRTRRQGRHLLVSLCPARRSLRVISASGLVQQRAPANVPAAGILPPPLSKVSGSLPRDEGYQTFLARIANLSLNAHVYLKALPPVVASTSAAEGHSWWTDDKELSSVVKMCRKSPATPMHSLPLTSVQSRQSSRRSARTASSSALTQPCRLRTCPTAPD